jgi:hypothetical protein
LKIIKKRYEDMYADRDHWCRRWQGVRQGFKDQKRQIKALLQEQGIEVKAGAQLSKLLRLDNIPF